MINSDTLGVENNILGIFFTYSYMSNSYFSLKELKHNISINRSKKMSLEISEIVLAKSFLVLGLLAFACIGFATLVNQKQKGAAVK